MSLVSDELEVQEAPLSERYRSALRGIGATVTVISTQEAGERHCMVATATMSVSLEPPVLMIAVNQSASIHAPILRRGAFAVNALSAEHVNLGKAIASAARHDRFNAGVWLDSNHPDHPDTQGLPYLDEAQSTVFCRVLQTVAHGTHTLFIGEVVDVREAGSREPLLYCDGSYGRFVAGGSN